MVGSTKTGISYCHAQITTYEVHRLDTHVHHVLIAFATFEGVPCVLLILTKPNLDSQVKKGDASFFMTSPLSTDNAVADLTKKLTFVEEGDR